MDNERIAQFLIAIVGISAIVAITCTWTKEEVKTDATWCEVGYVNDDGSITYAGPDGSDEVIIMATTDGPKVMSQNCNEK